jgi:hypothetical protein
MRFRCRSLASLLVFACLGGCASFGAGRGWQTLLDGSRPETLANWNRVGEDNWRVEAGTVMADSRAGKDSSYLVSKASYADFEVRAEVWVSHDANSGVFFRIADPKAVSIKNSYEMNIYDEYKIPEYGTGSIATRAGVHPMPKAGGKWSTFVVTARGTHIVVTMDGAQTVDFNDNTYASGPLGLQYGGGVVKWRKVQVRRR